MGAAKPNASRRQFLAGSLAAATKPNKIDCQSHLFSEDFLQLLEKRKSSPYVYRKGDAW